MDRAEPIDAVEVGEIIGGYRLERLLGAGAVSRVFLGTHLRLGRRAAIKVLTPPLVDDVRVTSRFLAEARVVNGIRHPSIVDISDFLESTEPRRLALVMEHIEGPSLKKVVREGPPLSFVQAIGVLLQLADALGAAHTAGVVHRDLKPDNLLLTSEPDEDPSIIPGLKIVDFGIAKIGAWGDKTATGMMIGTPAYMAPEQIAGRPPPSSASDVFAFGELLYELTTRQRAYPTGAVGAVIQAKLKGELPKLVVPPVPGGVAILDAVRRCLSLRPQDRPRLDELMALLVEVCPDAERALPRGAKKRPPSSEAETIEPPARTPAEARPVLQDRAEASFGETVRPPSGPVIGGPVIGGPVIGGPVIGGPVIGGPVIGAASTVAAPIQTTPSTPAVAALAAPIQTTPSTHAVAAASTIAAPIHSSPRVDASIAPLISAGPTLADEEPPIETVTPVMPRALAPSGDTVTPVMTASAPGTATPVLFAGVAAAAALASPVSMPLVDVAAHDGATPVGGTPSRPSFVHTAPRARSPWLVVGAASVVLAIAVAVTLTSEERSTDAPATATTQDPAASAERTQQIIAIPRARAEPSTNEQRVEVTSVPEGARVDDVATGAELGHTPLAFTARGGAPSQIRISSDGFEPVEVKLVGPNPRVMVALTARTSVRGAAKSDTAKSDAAKSDAAKSDAAKSDAAKSDATKNDATKNDATKPRPPAPKPGTSEEFPTW